MTSIAFYFLLAQFLLSGHGAWDPESKRMDTTPVSDTCHKVADYRYNHKVLEGMVCNDKREGIWKEWYIDGRLKDSAMYSNGVRIYAASAIHEAKGLLLFRGDPKKFFQDSTYECSVRINVRHAIKDIKGDYDGVSDTVYPPLFYFGADMGARDEFQYYFIPKAAGKYKLRISLSGDAAATTGSTAFYEQEIEVLKK